MANSEFQGLKLFAFPIIKRGFQCNFLLREKQSNCNNWTSLAEIPVNPEEINTKLLLVPFKPIFNIKNLRKSIVRKKRYFDILQIEMELKEDPMKLNSDFF